MRRPLVPEDLDRNGHAREAAVRSLSRSTIAIGRAAFEPRAAGEIARKAWGSDAARDVTALVQRAVSAPALTTTTGWAAELAHVTLEFLDSLVGQSAAADLLSRGLQLTFEGNQTINLPTMAQTPAGFVGQGKPIPIVQYTTASSVKLEPHKFAVATTLTRELLTSANAEPIMRATLAHAATLGLDAALFSANAGTVDQPAGLLNGISPTTASTSTILGDAMLLDISNIGGAVARVAGSNIAFVAAPEQALAIALNAGDFDDDYLVLATSALAKGTVLAIAVNALASAFDPVPEITSAIESASMHMDGSSPADIVTAGGAVAVPTTNVFQTDRVALRMRMPCAWALRAPGAIAFVQSVVW
jgi:HK97 family phage major capsid protein